MRLMKLPCLLAALTTLVGCDRIRSRPILTSKACLDGGVAYAGGGAAGDKLNVSWFCSNGDRFYVIVTDGHPDPEVRAVPGGCPSAHQ
jgi:hypothetical protein